MNSIFVTGAAGFIGSHLVDRLLADGKCVVGYDNFSTGQREFLPSALTHPKFTLVEGDCLDLSALTRAVAGCDFVFHLAANADVRFGLEHPHKDFQQNAVGHVQRPGSDARQRHQGHRVQFHRQRLWRGGNHPDAGKRIRSRCKLRLYAASKLAGEGFIHAYCEGYGFEGYIFRFVSILGERYTHGHVFDFYKQLLDHPDHLKVLGDGTQRKSYLYIGDCLEAMLHVVNRATAGQAKHHVVTYNLGADEYVEVNNSVKYICRALGLKPKLEYTGGNKGWVGDNPFIFLDTKKIRATGWKSTLTIEQSILRTLQWLQKNQWVLQRR